MEPPVTNADTFNWKRVGRVHVSSFSTPPTPIIGSEGFFGCLGRRHSAPNTRARPHKRHGLTQAHPVQVESADTQTDCPATNSQGVQTPCLRTHTTQTHSPLTADCDTQVQAHTTKHANTNTLARVAITNHTDTQTTLTLHADTQTQHEKTHQKTQTNSGNTRAATQTTN